MREQVTLHTMLLDGAPDASWPACLNADETARAQRYVHERDRDRFVAARAGLRHVLGRHCGVAPAAVQFTYGPHGRPSLSWPSDGPDFNLSHSQHFAAVAVSSHCRVGLDVEVVKPFDLHYRDLVGYALGESEREQLAAARDEARAEVFLRFWTAKEAFLKLHGMGLTIEPREVAVDPGSGLVVHGERAACLVFPRVAPGVVAALVTLEPVSALVA